MKIVWGSLIILLLLVTLARSYSSGAYKAQPLDEARLLMEIVDGLRVH